MSQKPVTYNNTKRAYDEITPKTISSGATDAGKIFVPGSDGKWDESLLPNVEGGRAFVASEALSAGDFINVFDESGTPKLRKADASSLATKAHGFVKTSANVGDSVKLYGNGVVSGLQDLITGETYVLSDVTAGEVSTTAPTATGHIVQTLGFAVSATEMQVNIAELPIVRS